MTVTTDDQPGPRIEEEIQLEAQVSDPTVAGAIRYVSGSFRFKDGTGVFDPRTDNDAIHNCTAAEISGIDEKVSPVAADLVVIEDSEAANVKKRVQVGNLPTSGDVVGPASATDNAACRFNGTTGNLIQNSGVIIDDNDYITANGARFLGESATDPGSPEDGDLYYNTVLKKWMSYDGTRSKFLTVESFTMHFGRKGATATGAYYKGIERMSYSATKGILAPFKGTVIAMGYTRDDTDAATFEVTKDGSSLATLASSAIEGKDTTLNADFAADEVLGVKNQSGGNDTLHVIGWVTIKWRV
jgi:hypothetical protein